MKLAPGMPLSAALAFDASAPLPAARLAMDAGIAQLEWSREVVVRKLSVSPLRYPPEAGLHAAASRDFAGLHGFLADSLPERWGYLLMRERLRKLGVDIATLDALDRLALVGSHGRGALVFEPATTPSGEIATLNLDALAKDAMALLAGEEAGLADTLARLGGGSGGARPKIHVDFDGEGNISAGAGEIAVGRQAWIVKFRAPQDVDDAGPLEEAYASMAEAAGLAVSEHRLIAAKTGYSYFATRRFDRPMEGRRLHMVSLAGAAEAPHDLPSSYDLFLRATRAITRRADDVEAAFRRMVFNVLACNRDDHTRQHAYLMDETGDWRLAPAYDLTYSQGPGGEHYLDVAGEGRRPTRAHVVKLGVAQGFDERRIAATIGEVRAAVSGWTGYARRAGVSKDTARIAAEAHARIWADFA